METSNSHVYSLSVPAPCKPYFTIRFLVQEFKIDLHVTDFAIMSICPLYQQNLLNNPGQASNGECGINFATRATSAHITAQNAKLSKHGIKYMLIEIKDAELHPKSLSTINKEKFLVACS